jgi:TolB protein
MHFRTTLCALASLTVIIFTAAASYAQTTSPASGDSGKHADTMKSRYTIVPVPKGDTAKAPGGLSLQTIHMTPIYAAPTEDNAAIDSVQQFKGARNLPDSAHYPGEKHLRNIRQLTFDGENTNAKVSPDGKYIVFQARSSKPGKCDQIFMMTLDGKRVRRISQGYGATAAPCFFSSGNKILYASTHAQFLGQCPPQPDSAKGYVWPLISAYDLYIADTNGTPISRLTTNNFYDAEPTMSLKSDRIVFTSTRGGDIDLWSVRLDGSDARQLTHENGYDGNAALSPDGSKIAFCASRPTGDALTQYRTMLQQGLFVPDNLEIYVMNADGSDQKQLTHLGGLYLAPAWTPDGKHLIFSSDHLDPTGKNFDLFTIDKDASHLDRITYGGGFNGFPAFSHDGKHLIFSSNRNGSLHSNIFIADWEQ